MLTITSLAHKSIQNRIKTMLFTVIKKTTKLAVINNAKGKPLMLVRYSKKNGFEFFDKNFKNITITVLDSLKLYGTL